MAVVPKIDNKSPLHRLNRDPILPTVLGGLKAPNLVLKQERDGSGVGVALETKSEVRLGALGVVIHHHFLVHVDTGLRQCVLLQPHCLRQYIEQLAGEIHQLLAVLLRH